MSSESDQQILVKAIKKAVKGGLDKDLGKSALDLLPKVFSASTYVKDGFVRGIIFDHDFAKALWPNDKAGNVFWRMHLERMVVAEDSLKYLGANL